MGARRVLRFRSRSRHLRFGATAIVMFGVALTLLASACGDNAATGDVDAGGPDAGTSCDAGDPRDTNCDGMVRVVDDGEPCARCSVRCLGEGLFRCFGPDDSPLVSEVVVGASCSRSTNSTDHNGIRVICTGEGESPRCERQFGEQLETDRAEPVCIVTRQP